MHEFNSRLSFQNLKNQSKNRELRCKRIQTYWQSSHRGWLVIDINFTQNKAGIFWHWHWFTSFCGWHGNGTWRCSNAVFKHKNCLNKNVQILYIYSLTSLCSQSNQAYHLHSVCILHWLLNTMKWSKSKSVAMSGGAGYQQILLWTFYFSVAHILLILSLKGKIRKRVNFQVCMPLS